MRSTIAVALVAGLAATVQSPSALAAGLDARLAALFEPTPTRSPFVFVTRASSSGAFIAPDRIRLVSRGDGRREPKSTFGTSRPTFVTAELLGTRKAARVVGARKGGAFRRCDVSARRCRRASAFSTLAVRSLYRAVDASYRSRPGRLSLSLRLRPDSDPKAIRLRIAGARVVGGRLLVPGAKAPQPALRAFRRLDGRRTRVPARYVVLADGSIGLAIALPPPLQVDVELAYASGPGLHGSGGVSVIVDDQDRPIVASTAWQLPSAESGGIERQDGVVTRLGPSGGLEWTTSLPDVDVQGLAATPDGGAIVGGSIVPGDGELVAAGQAVVVSLAQDGSVRWSHRIDCSLRVRDVTSTGDGGTLAVGTTVSRPCFPTTPGAAFPATPGGAGGYDGFAIRFDAAGNVVYSTLLGDPQGWDEAMAVSADASGAAYVTGWAAPEFPSTPGAVARGDGGGHDPFVVKLDPTGSRLVYAGRLPGEGGTDIVVDAGGRASVAGVLDWTTTGFVARLDADGSVAEFVTALPGVLPTVLLGDSLAGLFVAGGLSDTGARDAWLGRIDAVGVLSQSRSILAPDSNLLTGAALTSDGRLLVAGASEPGTLYRPPFNRSGVFLEPGGSFLAEARLEE